MGATHFLTKTLPKVPAEMALSVLAFNLTRAMNIVGTKPLMGCDGGLRQARFLASEPTPFEAFLHGQDPLQTSIAVSG